MAKPNIPADVVADLKARFPERPLITLTAHGHTVVATVPNLAQQEQYEAQVLDKARCGTAMEDLLRACIVYPAREELAAMLDRQPGLVESWYKPLRIQAGGEDRIAFEDPPEEAATKCKAMYPDREAVVMVNSGGGFGASTTVKVLALVPGLAEMREFRRRLKNTDLRGGAPDWLTRSCILDPQVEGLNKLLDARPLLMDVWFKALMERAGTTEEVEVGKL